HKKAVARGAAAAQAIQADLLLEPPGADDERAGLPEAEVQAEDDAQVAAATARGGAATAAEQTLVDEMSAIAQRARSLPDARLRHLLGWIRENLCPDLGQSGAKWLPRRVLIFTEYADTKRWLEGQLREAISGSEDDFARIATFHGGMGEES